MPYKQLMIISFWLLILGQIPDTLAADMSTSSTLWIFALRILPLLVFAKVVHSDNARNQMWMCFIVLGYFVCMVLGVFHPEKTIWDICNLVSVIILFISAMMRSRQIALAQKKLIENQPKV